MCLHFNYKVKTIYGIKFGYKGFYSEGEGYEWVQLTKDSVRDIHNEGGTMLGTSRGGFDLEKIITNIKKNKIN